MVRVADVAAVVACVGLACSASGQISNWIGADGVFSDPANWDAGVPAAVTSTAGLGMGSVYTVTVDTSPSIGSVAISNASATLRIDPGRTLTLNSPTSTNNGIIALNPLASSLNSVLEFAGSTTMGGLGEIRMQTQADNSQLTGVGPLLNGGSHLVRGVGQILVPVNNFGEIRADASVSVSGNILEVRDQNLTNNGDLVAASGSVLRLLNIDIAQTPNGMIEAQDGGIVRFTSGSLSGGLVRSLGTGFSETESILDVSGVEFEGLFLLQAGDLVRVDGGGITNDGVIELNRTASSANAVMQFSQSALIGGTGEIHLRTLGDNAILDSLPGQTVTNSASHTIRGVGQVRASMINDGDVVADSSVAVSGATLQIQGNVVNNATLAAEAVSILQIEQVTVDQSAGGSVIARSAGIVNIQDTTILGGDVGSLAGGIIVFQNVAGGGLSDVTLSGEARVDAGRVLDIAGSGLTNHAVVEMNPLASSADSVLNFVNGGLLTGTGEVRMRTTGNNTRVETPSGTLTHGSMHTIRGVGEINAAMLNLGSVVADTGVSVSGTLLELGDNPKENRGTMSSLAGATLRINGVVVSQNSGGSMNAEAGARLEVQNLGGIQGGSVNGDGTLFFLAGAGSQSLSGVALNIDSEIVAGRRVDVDGAGVVNNAVMEMNPTGSSANAVLAATQNMTIGGSGEVRMRTSGTNTFLSSDPGTAMTNGVMHTVRGVGVIDAEYVNNGETWADVGVSVSGTVLELNGGTKTNNSTIGARTGSVLQTVGVDVNQSSAGAIVIEDGASLEMFAGTAISGGSIDGSGSGFARVRGATSFDGVVLNSGSIVNSSQTLSVLSSGLENNGSMTINPTFSSGDGVLDLVAGGTLSGSGEINLTTQGQNSVLTGGGAITNGAMHTISGRGVVDVDLINEGRIEPGNSGVGRMDMGAGYTQDAGGVLSVEISGNSGADADGIDVVGDALLAGEVEIHFVGGFVPAANATYTIVDAASVTGTFDVAPTIPNGLFVTRVVYEPTRVRVLTRCRADINLDGTVAPADFTAWLAAFNINDPLADVNLDGAISPADFTAWLGFFSQPCP